ncbi:hypothetical protein OHU11_04280 [Streptomyces sp. NBC_00257]|uniref:hypothetical protein n=1 Tax=unclassified Streptomyces TaxID=2593676 RepID=UPI002255D826|nr:MULTISPECIES: hypothetical protein [unclassified Streptomyces]MCX4398735.1 hypothetical protein [Streptomyces sp. NBC_01767]MCX4870949.1 hypothetical protein [Streptomyces sp. NBC_00906]MCX4901689.1 hypothetical protein [Streptomyces sp. NBC_00892]MCX5426931.1 hypothetical protein [Streptomyces sp. NBC_00062]WSP51027.1 hypothetical protein OG348_37175 [Streptomyces sp. NBC_01243]
MLTTAVRSHRSVEFHPDYRLLGRRGRGRAEGDGPTGRIDGDRRIAPGVEDFAAEPLLQLVPRHQQARMVGLSGSMRQVEDQVDVTGGGGSPGEPIAEGGQLDS